MTARGGREPASRARSCPIAGGPRHHPAGAAALLAVGLLAAALGLAACGGQAAATPPAATAKVLPQRIIPAPRSLLAAAGPQADGTMWAVAGSSSVGLFRFDSVSGRETASVSVSQATRSVAQTRAGVLAIALGSATSGALELIQPGKLKHRTTVGLPAPARQVVTAGSGSDFYALTAWPSSASVTIISSRNATIVGSVPAPKDTVSIAAAPRQGVLYALQSNGLVDEIALSGGSIQSSFSVGDAGESIALSPDGGQLYVLKGTAAISNIAVIDAATEAIIKVLPAPSHCRELLVAPRGRQLYEVVGSPAYGNIQVFGF